MNWTEDALFNEVRAQSNSYQLEDRKPVVVALSVEAWAEMGEPSVVWGLTTCVSDDLRSAAVPVLVMCRDGR